MKYKKSYYNIEVDKKETGEILLFNSVSTAYGVIRAENAKIYENLEFFDDNNTDNLCENEKSLYKTLIENRFLVEDGYKEKEFVKLTERFYRYNSENQEISLTIAPTSNCNMDCPYCYEKKNTKKMDEKVKSQLVNFVKSICANAKGLRIAWYGGEPLLELDTIRELSNEFVKFCTEKNINYRPSIITNGVLLTKDIATILVDECKIQSAQVTIDGLNDIHNNRRRLVDKSMKSFDIITNNIEEVKGLLHINVRINIDKENSIYIDDILKYLIEKQWVQKNGITFYFAPVHGMEEAGNYGIHRCFDWKEFGELESYIVRKMNEYEVYDSLRMFYPRPLPISCGALTPSYFVVGPEGELYKCWNYVGNESKIIGSIFDGTKMNDEFTNWLLLDSPKECCECKSYPVCRGGCPAERFTNGNKPACSHRKISNNERLKLIYDNYKNKPEEDKVCETCSV